MRWSAQERIILYLKPQQMTRKIYVGVDVGAKGGIFAMDQDRNVILKAAVPEGKDGIDYQELLSIFKNIRSRAMATTPLGTAVQFIAVIEDVHSIFGMSAKSNFSFGHIKGVKEAMMLALKYDYKLIPPKTWQKAVWIEEDAVYGEDKAGKKKRDTKATSLNAALRLFPLENFRKNNRCKIAHDGMVDAALMADYAMKNDDDE